MYSEPDRHTTVRVPLTGREIRESSYETMFLIAELSDAIRRGVYYFSMSGDPLPSLNEVLQALINEGEVAFDDDSADEPVAH